jgi:hypothetical protein
VLENFRGLPSDVDNVDLEIDPPFGWCSPIPYFPGRRYLVFPRRQDGRLRDGNCFQGRDIETATEDVRQVRDYFSGKLHANVYGRITMVGSGWPVPGVKVSTSRGLRTYSASTDSDGLYELQLPAEGGYRIRADLAPYESGPKEVFFPGPGCAVRDFGLTIDTTISGKVFDDRGQPLKGAEVGLIRLDRVPAPEQPTIVARAYTEEADTSFKFTNIPLGRYLIVFNPGGPTSNSWLGLPFESTYHPPGATRTSARTVEVNSPGAHLKGMDLAVGNRVSFRQVTVRVRFPDGVPMTTAIVDCVGVPLGQGDSPWFDDAMVDRETGLARFSAPANRELELKVGDSYGRNLKAVYRSKHEAGTTPIHEEFVVRP